MKPKYVDFDMVLFQCVLTPYPPKINTPLLTRTLEAKKKTVNN